MKMSLQDITNSGAKLVRLNQATLEGIVIAVSLAVSEDGKIVNLTLKAALSEELFAMYPTAVK